KTALPTTLKCRADSRCRNHLDDAAHLGVSGSDVADGDDLVFACAAGSHHFHDVSLGLADERTGHRAGDRNFVGPDIGFDITHNLIGKAFAGFDFLNFHRGAEYCATVDIERCRVDDLRIGQSALKFLDTTLNESLTLAGGVVFSVFREITL